MEVKQFAKLGFGNLTIITNKKTGINMFVAHEIGKMWKHSNIKQSINRLLNESESDIILKSKYPELFEHLINKSVFNKKAQRACLITSDGLIKLIFNCNTLIEKVEFMNWLKELEILKDDVFLIKERREIEFSKILLPFGKVYGYDIEEQIVIDKYRLDFLVRELNLIIEFDEENHQYYDKQKAKMRDEYLCSLGYKTLRIDCRMCYGEALAYLGYLFNEAVKDANKEALIFTDTLVNKGFDLKKVSELSLKCAVPLFIGISNLKIIPNDIN